MVQPIDESTHQELLALTPSGDLMDLARQLRNQGVESLVIGRRGGRITQVVTDRQIAQLAAPDSYPATRFDSPGSTLHAPPSRSAGQSVPAQSGGTDDGLVSAESPRSAEGEGIRGQAG